MQTRIEQSKTIQYSFPWDKTSQVQFPDQGSETFRMMLEEAADRYKPWESVHANFKQDEHGNTILHISDDFLPPSQLGKAPKIDCRYIPYGYMPRQFDARVPSSAVFEDLDDLTQGYTVEAFNMGQHGGTLNDYSQHPKVTREWQKRMGIDASSSGWNPWIQMTDGTTLRMPDVCHDTSTSTNFPPLRDHDVFEVMYSATLLSHYIDNIRTNPGDFFFVQVNHSPVETIDLDNNRKISPHFYVLKDVSNEKQRKFEVITTAQAAYPYLLEALPEEQKKILQAIDPKDCIGTIFSLLHNIEQIRMTNKEAMQKGITKFREELTEELRRIQDSDEKVSKFHIRSIQSFIDMIDAAPKTDEGYYHLIFMINRYVYPFIEVEKLRDRHNPKYSEVKNKIQPIYDMLASVKVSFADFRQSYSSSTSPTQL